MAENKQVSNSDPSHGGKLIKKEITDKAGRKQVKWIDPKEKGNERPNKAADSNVSGKGIDYTNYAKSASTKALKLAYRNSKDNGVKEAAQNELRNRGVDADEVDTDYISFEGKDNYYCDKFFDQYKSQVEGLSSSDIKLIDKFREEGWIINDDLRNGKSPSADVLNLDNLFNNFYATHSFEAKRGINVFQDVRDFFRNLDIGDVYEDDAFCSTTISDTGLQKFTKKERSFTMTIRIRKGQKLIPMQSIGGDLSQEYSDEYEFLLPRSSRFRVLKRQENDLTVELL